MDKRFFVFYVLIGAILLGVVLPADSLFALFAAMMLAVGCGALEGLHSLFRPASFAGAAWALVLLLGRAGIVPAAPGALALRIVSALALCLLALAVAALERETLGSPMVAWAAIVLIGAGCAGQVLLDLGLFPAAIAVRSYVEKAGPLGSIVLLIAVCRAQSAVIRKGE